MLPGNSQILTCPHCGTEKEVMSLISGNNFGAELWSDNKQIAPMLPEISYIQQCPGCGKYYIMNKQQPRYSTDSSSSEQGLLTFPQMKEAFLQLSQEGLSPKEEAGVRFMMHHVFNDYYHRSGQDRPISEEDRLLFHDNGLWLIQHLITDDILKAEFYRQIGELEQAAEVIETVHADNGFLVKIVRGIRERLNKGDCNVFRIE